MEFIRKNIIPIVALICFFLGLYRVSGFFISDVPYGYDAGFYRIAILDGIKHLPYLDLTARPGFPYHEPLFVILTNILSFIGISPDAVIGLFLGGISMLTGICFYLFAKRLYGTKTGLIALSLYFLSLVQYDEFYMNYWRNSLGIVFFLTSLSLLEMDSYLSLLSIAGMMSIHRPTAYIFVLIWTVSFVVRGVSRSIWNRKQLIMVVSGILLSLPLYSQEISALLDAPRALVGTLGGSTLSGNFLTTQEFFGYIFPYFLISIPAIFFKTQHKEYDIGFIGLVVTLFYSILRLYFYSRLLVFLDIFFILMSAYSLSFVLSRHLSRTKYTLIFLIFFAIQGGIYSIHAKDSLSRHPISREEFDIVRNLSILIGDTTTVLSTHKYYTPWLVGYSGHETLAPGLLGNQIWDEKKWNHFSLVTTTPEQRCEMLQEYKKIRKNLVVFIGDQQPPINISSQCSRILLSNQNHPILYEITDHQHR